MTKSGPLRIWHATSECSGRAGGAYGVPLDMVAVAPLTGAVAKRMGLTDKDNPGKPWNFYIEWQRLAANTTVVHVAGDLRGDGASSLRRTLAGELTGTPELLVLGLSDIEQIDGDGIDALHSVAELADEDDIRLCLVILPKGAVRACLKVVELMKTFQTFSSVTEVLQHPHYRPA